LGDLTFMFIDEVKVAITAGNGGPGRAAFAKTKNTLGPTGGSGGAGGSIYAEGASDLSLLTQFYYKKHAEAENGGIGKTKLLDGRGGRDLIFKVPVGTKFYNLTNGNIFEIIKIGERKLLAKGGKGGRGNFHYRSSRNTSPVQFQKGLPGEVFDYRLELQLIADVGFIGLPNAGKSSLLNELTRAGAKVANYKFTTLEPNLGAYYDLILADIPGLIEGASKGRGLGFKFLRHISRAKILFHLVSAESDDPVRDYIVVRRELGAHSKELLEKEEYVFLAKSDLLSEAELKQKLLALKKMNHKVNPLSIHDYASVERVKKLLGVIQNEKRATYNGEKDK